MSTPDVVAGQAGGLRVEKVITSGTFELDGGVFDVDNNVYLIGDDHEVIVVDAGHESAPILAAIGDRTVKAVLSTHGHNDHVNAAIEVSDATHGPVYLHPADTMLWENVHPQRTAMPLADEDRFSVGGVAIHLVHTPGHSPGAMCLVLPDLATVLTGDTLFRGGPGATGRSFSSFEDILVSIKTRLLTLPAGTTVLTGHGDSTSIGAEAGDYDAWVARGR